MVHIEFVSKDFYKNSSSVEKLIYYATHKDGRQVNCFGGFNVNVYNATEQFNAVKTYFEKHDDHRKIRHIVIDFDPKRILLTALDAEEIAKRICLYYSNRYQIVYGIHENTEQPHIHIVFNATSFVDGRQYSEGEDDYYRFCNFVNEVVREYLSNN